MKESTVIGIDLSKSVFQVCVVNSKGKVVLNREMTRKQLLVFLAKQEPSVVAVEACGSAHYWARKAKSYGHEAKMIPTKSVAAFRQGQKTDANDALAIVLAAQQPEVKLAGIKSVDQQSLQCDTRVNEHLSDQLTATGNMLRGLVAEFGVTIPKGKNALKRALPLILEDAENGLPMGMRESVYLGWALWLELEQLLQRSDTLFAKRSAENEACQRLEKLEGVGPKNALRLYVALGNGEHFKNGREAAACVGVTPKQYSTGGKVVMRGIGKFKDDSVERLSERWHRFA